MKKTTRRSFLVVAGSALAAPAFAETTVDLPIPGGPQERAITKAFPQKGPMILQRTRPPLLETPFEVFDKGVFTPNDQFFVRWHWAVIPTEIDVASFRLSVKGHVEKELDLTLRDIVDGLPRVELAAVNQCSGNSRGFTEPRVAGAQWANGAMGNAKWMGVRLKDVLDKAGIKAGAQGVRFAMNGEQLPLLNGFPLRLVVPGWFSTYWVKMLDRIEVLAETDRNFWTTSAYLIPDTPGADMKPGQTGLKMVPITRMVPRSFVTNFADGATLKAGAKTQVRGIALGGATGVKSVELSLDGGTTWQPTVLGPDEGKYSFRLWQAEIAPPAGPVSLMVRCTNSDGLVQPMANNPAEGGLGDHAIQHRPDRIRQRRAGRRDPRLHRPSRTTGRGHTRPSRRCSPGTRCPEDLRAEVCLRGTAGERGRLPHRAGRPGDRRQLPVLPFRRHGADPAHAVQGGLGRYRRQDDPRLQGAGRPEGRRRDRRLPGRHQGPEVGPAQSSPGAAAAVATAAARSPASSRMVSSSASVTPDSSCR